MIPVRLKYEVEAGPDLIPSRSGVRTLRSAGLYRYQHVEVDSSLFVSERICGVRCRKYRGREVRNNITKCETLLRSSRQIYILENIFTYHKTQLHGKNTFTKDETNLHFRKQINKTQNTFTSPETNLQ